MSDRKIYFKNNWLLATLTILLLLWLTFFGGCSQILSFF